MGRGVVVDVVVVDVVVVVEDVLLVVGVVVVVEDVELTDCLDVVDVVLDVNVDPTGRISPVSVVVDAMVGLTGVVTDVVVVVGTEAFCNPSVFQMDGPTELNHGGLGLAVDDVGVAEKNKIKSSII